MGLTMKKRRPKMKNREDGSLFDPRETDQDEAEGDDERTVTEQAKSIKVENWLYG